MYKILLNTQTHNEQRWNRNIKPCISSLLKLPIVYTAMFRHLHLLFHAASKMWQDCIQEKKKSTACWTDPLDPAITRFWTATGAPRVPLLIPALYTRDQPLANRDIYTLVKVGRCYPAVVESKRMPGIIRPCAKPALAASRTRSF